MFKVSIFTVEGILFSDLAQEVCIPTEEEQISILDFHHPIVARLSKGAVNIDNKKYLKIIDGMAFFDNNELKMIVGIE